jgi:hypothetical protein
MAGPDDPYIVEGLEVCVVVESSHKVRKPTPTERLVLDQYFASPAARDEAGRPYHMYGEELPGIDGLVLTYVLPT